MKYHVQGWRYVSETEIQAPSDSFILIKQEDIEIFRTLFWKTNSSWSFCCFNMETPIAFCRSFWSVNKNWQFPLSTLGVEIKIHTSKKDSSPILQTRCHNMLMKQYYKTELYFWKSVTIEYLWTCIQAGPPVHFALTAAMTHFNEIFSRCAFAHII